MSLRYLDPWDLGTLGPWDSWTSSLLQHLLIFSHTSSYFLLLSSFGMVWIRGGDESNIGGWDWRWTFDLYIDLKKLWGGWMEPWNLLLPSTFSSFNLLHLLVIPPSYSFLLPHLLLKGLRWLISSYMKRFQYYSAQKSFMVGGWIHCNYRYKLQVQIS